MDVVGPLTWMSPEPSTRISYKELTMYALYSTYQFKLISPNLGEPVPRAVQIFDLGIELAPKVLGTVRASPAVRNASASQPGTRSILNPGHNKLTGFGTKTLAWHATGEVWHN
jgi:hypothetical protein